MEQRSPQSPVDKALYAWADAYAEKPYVRALFVFITGLIGSAPVPGLSAVMDTATEMMTIAVEEMRRERQKAFFDELEKGEILLTEKVIQQEDFLHAFMATYSAAMRTRQREKIRQFARMLLSGVRENELDSSQMEEFMSILSDLSPRELDILLLLQEFESTHPHQMIASDDDSEPKEENDLQRAMRFWDDFVLSAENRLCVSKSMLPSTLIRLQRTGLYETFAGMFLGYESGRGRTTPLFNEFTEWIEDEMFIDKSRHTDNEN